MLNSLNDLRALTETVLNEKDSAVLSESIRAMQDIYTAHTGINAENFSKQGIDLPSGLAISPYQAAACLGEAERTVVFLRGIYKAILQQRKDNPGQRINFLYAGCGPYAALLTPFTVLFGTGELAFYLLDISSE